MQTAARTIRSVTNGYSRRQGKIHDFSLLHLAAQIFNMKILYDIATREASRNNHFFQHKHTKSNYIQHIRNV
ncbi:hypothetical protein [Akkermansia glycaniphila]|uniref:hypothetical protein n=1 Tax=Akkermansia glycaniphila TaxID=1679444 RepID=UPI00159EF161|nr:hypothetical protein [Akkermansia glycaniphila]